MKWIFVFRSTSIHLVLLRNFFAFFLSLYDVRGKKWWEHLQWWWWFTTTASSAAAERRWLREHGQNGDMIGLVHVHIVGFVCCTFLLSKNGGRQHVKLISCRDSNFFFGLWIMGSEWKTVSSRPTKWSFCNCKRRNVWFHIFCCVLFFHCF